MLPNQILSRILDYFFNNQEDLYRGEVDRAVLEFFNVKNIEQLRHVRQRPMNKIQEGLVNEWILYDFKLKNGSNLIESYKENNFLAESELKIYNDILSTNFYSLFEARKIMLDKGLVLRDLKTNIDYEVKEKLATRGLQKGNLIFGRLAKFNGHWELIGANSPVIPAVKIDNNLRKIYLEDKNLITPKMAFELAETEKEIEERSEIDFREARLKFEKELERFNLNRFVSVDLIEKWCREDEDKSGTEIISLLFSLLGDNKPRDPQDLNNFFDALLDFYNIVPQKCLNGKSPQEMAKENPNKRPQLKMSLTTPGGEKWWKELEKAHHFMKKHNDRKSVNHFEKTFYFLKKEFAANPDIYRLYANAAVCYFNYGERFLGKAMAGIALKLNPNYDFGQKIKRDYMEGKYEKTIEENLWHKSAIEALLKEKITRKTKPKYKIKNKIINEILEGVEEFSKAEEKYVKKLEEIKEKQNKRSLFKIPSVLYYQYIRDLGINFKTEKLTDSVITIYDSEGNSIKVGRNEPCPCDSGKKYKKCHGK